MFTNSSKLIKNQRFKAAIYAKVGVGKTQFALQFPGVAALDWERGMEPYVGKYDFDVDFVSTVEETEKAVRELAKDPQHYKTLVIDPISKLCAAYAERRRQLKITETGDKNYELDIRTDYGPIKRDIANFITMLLKLDMNIIVTARQKDLYAKGAFMVINGAAPDYHQILSELFDTVIYVEVDPEDSKRWAYTDAGAYDGVIPNGTITAKDRYDLPGKFEFSYENVIKYLSQDALTKDASTVDLEVPEETVTSNRILK